MLRSRVRAGFARTDYHQGLTSPAAQHGRVRWRSDCGEVPAPRTRSVLLLFVAVELVVGVYAITHIVGPIQFYLVQWISAVGFVMWLANRERGLGFVRARWSGAVAWRTSPGGRRSCWFALLVVAVQAFPHDAGQMNRDLDVPNDRKLFGFVSRRSCCSAPAGSDRGAAPRQHHRMGGHGLGRPAAPAARS